mmetsp:Transcript_8336/g.1110  ORF Transcript_8336/g.1110 Transcript_8336/m.1110 type:complete len:86 (-) Transcript_8336:5541-5798(-)
MFRLETWLGVNLLDYNDHFWQIGFYPSFDELTSTTAVCATNCKPSQTGSYAVSFTTPTAIPSNARFYIRFPTILTLQSHAPCTSA